MRKCHLLQYCFLMNLWSFASALDFYVSATSSNAFGDNESFQGLRNVQDAVQKAIAGGMTEDITVHVADGMYYLDSPFNFTSADSGKDGHTIFWKASGANATVSGGLHVTGWVEDEASGIWHASVPQGTQSRNLYVNGWAANYARTQLNRTDFTVTNTSYTWKISEYDWLMNTSGIANAELRSLQSFTDRYSPIQAVGYRELIMAQDCWENQIIGWDDMTKPYADFGLYVQNALALLDEGGEFYLDSEEGIVYYKPLAGEDMSTADTHLGLFEAIVSISGTYDDPVHDIVFDGLNFAHSTWLRPGSYGYVDQQTGGYIGQNVTYPAFEASRSHWYQNPGAIQISAAYNIHFTNGSFTQMGAGGFGIGNDINAHVSGIGLGAKNVSVSKSYFTQVMGNGITAGGINIPAHHPNDSRMINSEIHISENIFYNMSALFSSCVPIIFTYVQYSSITNNDISYVPYSGICHGYGWGMNDAGGSELYVDFGTYNYQPLFETPTTSQNNLVRGNLIHGYGFSHTDLGAIYTLSKSPSTYIVENYALNSTWYGVYTDEGSNSLIILNNSFMSQGGEGYGWYNPDQGSGTNLDPGMHTANNTLIDNFGEYAPGRDFTDAPNGTGILNNTFLRNFVVDSLLDTTAEGQRVAYRAGIPPGKRGSRPVTNPPISDTYASIQFPTAANGILMVDLWNFDDMALINVSFDVSTNETLTVQPLDVPTTVPADSHRPATWKVISSGCTPSHFSVHITYTNSRTMATNTISVGGTPPGLPLSPTNTTWSFSSTWPSIAGQMCDNIFGIRTGGRAVNATYDDWAVLYKPSAIGHNGSVSASVLSVDAVSPNSTAGVVIRDSFATHSPSNDARHVNATGYAAVFVAADGRVTLSWDEAGAGFLSNSSTTVDPIAGSAPVQVRLDVEGTIFRGYYANTTTARWTQIGPAVTVPRNATYSDAGVIANSHGGFADGTAIFGFVNVTL